MLRTKLFKGVAVLVVMFSVLSAFVGIRIIKDRVIDEAQNRVRLDLSSAWAIQQSRLHEIETILRLVAAKQVVGDISEQHDWSNLEARNRLERIRANFGLDFLDLTDPTGQVVVRTAPPFTTGDYKATDPLVSAALRGETLSGVTVLTAAEMNQEADGLSDRAFLELEETPRARRTMRTEETRGMVMASASPITRGSQVLGAAYGGVLVNRNHALVDQIQNVVFKNEEYKGVPVGTATIFLNDSRVATTVRLANGNRALGTRASKEVADQVLDNGKPWLGEAFVVRERYLAAYDPIRDVRGEIVGMLYVGLLERRFQDIERGIILRYVYVSLFVLAVGLALAFAIASRLADPIHRLVAASHRMCEGERPPPVRTNGACHETEELIQSFNRMAVTLAEREDSLRTLNRSYMETLGFVSHELKSPLASMMNYTYLLQLEKLGPLTEKQKKALGVIDGNTKRLVEMVRHYLNLARIENGEMSPVPTRLSVLPEVLKPILESAEADAEARHMKVENRVGPDVALQADINMVREVFENLVSNAVKYGREGGTITLAARDDGAFVEFSVRNEGEGIPPERLGELFQKFSRLESMQAAKRQKGTGLGLFITKSIVEAHGGRIEPRSQPGEWVEFVFTLPRAAPKAETPGAEAAGRAENA
jgi:two-component system NtrC family sensor kinase